MKKRKSGRPQVEQHSLDELLERGSGLLHAGQAELAVPFLDRARAVAPDNTEVLDLIGEAYVDLGEYTKARQAFERSIQIAPEESGTKWMFLGQISTGATALQFYQRGIELLMKNPNDNQRNKDISRAYVSVAELYLTDLCMETNAEQNCEEAVRFAENFDPESLEALQTKASMRLSQNRNDEAVEALVRIAGCILNTRIEDREVAFEFCVQTCRLLVEVGQNALAVQLLENLLKEDDENVEIWILLGHSHTGSDTDAALECFERAEELLEEFLNADPSDELFRAQLQHVREALGQMESSEEAQ